MEEERCEVAVVGAGPAGIAAACRAAEAGARVRLLDSGLAPGGQIWRRSAGVPQRGTAAAWLRRLAASGARTLARTSVVDAADQRALLAEREGRPLRVRAERLVLATGARELFLPFPGWTLPDAIGVGAAQALVKSGLDVRGRRAVVAGSGPLLLPAAAALAAGGAEVALVAEQAPPARVARFAAALVTRPAKVLEGIRLRAAFARTPYRTGVWVAAAEGEGRVERVALSDGRRSWSERCDLLCCAFGLVPNLELPRLLGCAVEDGVVSVDDAQATSLPGIYCAGEPTGIGGVELALAEGEIAGLAAAGGAATPALRLRRRRGRSFARRLAAAFAPRAELRALAAPDTIVCRCEDVSFGAFAAEWSARQAKLYTRSGMGPCQGRVCGPALRFLFGWGHDSVRPPLEPVSVATLVALGREDGADPPGERRA